MKLLQKIGFTVFVSILTLSFSQCTSVKKTMEITKIIELPKELTTDAYYQNWVAGVRGGGSGTNLYINKSVVGNKQLIAAYFKEKIVDFEPVTKMGDVYVARFKGKANQIYDMEMNADGINEYGNKAPIEKKDFPFKLAPNEAVVSYIENNIVKYLKLINISKKESLAYPSAPRN